METYLDSEPFFERCNFAVLFFSLRASPSHQALDSSSSCLAPVRGPLSLSSGCSTQINLTFWRQNSQKRASCYGRMQECSGRLLGGGTSVNRTMCPSAWALSSERFHFRFLGSHTLVLPGQASETEWPHWPGRCEGPPPGALAIAGR